MQTSTPEQLALTQTVAENVLNGPIGVEPGKRVRVVLIWRNWCQAFPEGGVVIRLLLTATNETLDTDGNTYVGGRCDVPNARSSMMVSHFQH